MNMFQVLMIIVKKHYLVSGKKAKSLLQDMKPESPNLGMFQIEEFDCATTMANDTKVKPVLLLF